MRNAPSTARPLAAEGLGTALLLIAVVGSGIMAERLAGGNVAIALLANTAATAAALIVLILMLGPVSGAHFNPAVTLAMALRRRLPWPQVAPYVAVQIAGGIIGVVIAHAMFELPAILPSQKVRFGMAQLLAEFVATFGLLGTIWAVVKHRPEAVAYAVAAWIAGAYWFTASTSFANPAVTIARSLSDTFAGIRPVDAPGFILAQLLGAGAATLLFRWLLDERD
jgi:glycerol uptake facilitator-like aquaporin